MRRFTLLGATVILSAAIITPVLAQAVNQKPGTQEPGNGRGKVGVMASAPLLASKRGIETSTRPWLAPVGHRQPRVDEIPVSAPLTQEVLDQEDASVDRKINNICRGC
jgi:hypothetical protein